MQKLVIKGGNKLYGKVKIGGAKNAALPIIAAALLAEGTYCIGNIPKLRDICTMAELMSKLNVDVQCNISSRFKTAEGVNADGNLSSDDVLCFTNNGGELFEAPYELVSTMRASILVLGPLVARRGRAKVSLPGGCAIGERPVDLHLSALEKMGAKVSVSHGYIYAECARLKGADVNFKTITVTGTENIMMAACLADGVTTLNNAAQEPEVVDLADFLNAMGAKITGAGTSCITIEGVDKLNACNYTVMPDRIEAGTFLYAAAGTGGEVEILNAPVKQMKAVIDTLRMTGIKINAGTDSINLVSDGRLDSVDIVTSPYPGFPTDMQAQFTAIMTKASGSSVIDETIFENRFMHVAELKRMGADIILHNSSVVVRGVKELSGAPVMASDLRASACLVIAGLMASNTSEVHRVYHLDRGYEGFETKLSAMGADIKRVFDNSDK